MDDRFSLPALLSQVLVAFNYLTELQRHARELAENPSAGMPWNYRETLARRAYSRVI
jgi:hypothetical protein